METVVIGAEMGTLHLESDFAKLFSLGKPETCVSFHM